MGKKSNKLKKALDVFPDPPPDADDGLMDDLLAQLDSRNETVAQESANVLNEMEINKQAEQLETTSKQDAKSRFKARQASRSMKRLHTTDSNRCEKQRHWRRPMVLTILQQRPGLRRKQKTKKEISNASVTS